MPNHANGKDPHMRDCLPTDDALSMSASSPRQRFHPDAGVRRTLQAVLTAALLLTAVLVSVVPTEHAAAAAPANDLIENAIPITAVPFTNTQDSTDATVSPTDPPAACNQSASYSLWYVYTAATDGRIKATTSAPNQFAAPLVTVYSGAPGALTQVGCSGQAVPVAAGTTYYLRLSVPGCCFGTFTLDVAVPPPPPANDLIENAIPITAVPFTNTQDSTDATVSPTDPPAACGLGTSSYSLWYTYTAPAEGAIKIVTSSTATFATPHATVYSGSPGALTQLGCQPIVTVTAGTTYYVMLSVPGCCFGPFTIDVGEAHPPANDLIEHATIIDQLPFHTTQDSADATRSASDPPSACIGGDVPTLWYTFTASGDGLVQAVTSGGFTTFLTLYAGQPDALTPVGCTFGGAARSFDVTKGSTYYVAVTALQRDAFTLDVQQQLTVTVPHDLMFEATGPNGAVVEYAATATLPDGSPASINCSPSTGSTLALGDTTVTCIASDAVGHTLARSFSVHVVDTTPPAVTVPADTVTVDATGPAGAAVSYVASGADAVDPNPVVTCDPPAQAVFAIGDTTVHCLAQDSSGNRSTTAQFTVHVKGSTEELHDLTNAVALAATPAGIRTGLLADLDAANRALSSGKATAACGSLTDFTGLVSDQAGKKLTAVLAGQLIDQASRIKTVIGCRSK
jgi:hypothetical protein